MQETMTLKKGPLWIEREGTYAEIERWPNKTTYLCVKQGHRNIMRTKLTQQRARILIKELQKYVAG